MSAPRLPAEDAPPKLLIGLVRLQGLMLMCALGPIFMPTSGMQSIHSMLGMGVLPEQPIVEYLTRSLSGLYAMHGLITFFISLDLRRYRPLVGLMISANGALGLTLLGIDLWAGMPWWWTLFEGPPIALVAGVMGALFLRWPQPIQA